MEPGKTSFFQALGVPTKIARGTIEITSDLKLVESGAKVGASEATLLNMLNISPFTYGLTVEQVYDDGNCFPSEVLDITDEQLRKSIQDAITRIAAISLATGIPTAASVIHSFVNSYKNLIAIALETEITFPEVEELKDRIANPEAYAAAAPAAAAAPEEKKEEAKAEESEEESDEEGGFGGLLYVLPRLLIVSTKTVALTFGLLAVKFNHEDVGKWCEVEFVVGRISRPEWATFRSPYMIDDCHPKSNAMIPTPGMTPAVMICDILRISQSSFMKMVSSTFFFAHLFCVWMIIQQ